MEKCLRQWSEHTLSGVRSSSCRSTLPQAPPAQPNSNWSQMSAVQPSVCFRVWPAQPPSQPHLTSFTTLLAAQTSSSVSTDYYKARQGIMGIDRRLQNMFKTMSVNRSLIYLHKTFLLPARRSASAVFAMATWLAGWLDVRRRYCVLMAKPILKLFQPSGSPSTLVF